MPFVSRNTKREAPPGPRWKATVTHKLKSETDTIAVCGEGSPFRLAIMATMEWPKVTCPKCKRLNKEN